MMRAARRPKGGWWCERREVRSWYLLEHPEERHGVQFNVSQVAGVDDGGAQVVKPVSVLEAAAGLKWL